MCAHLETMDNQLERKDLELNKMKHKVKEMQDTLNNSDQSQQKMAYLQIVLNKANNEIKKLESILHKNGKRPNYQKIWR